MDEIRFEARVQTMGEHKGKVAWDIYVDDKHHGGGLSEPSLVAAMQQATYYIHDVEQLEDAADAVTA